MRLLEREQAERYLRGASWCFIGLHLAMAAFYWSNGVPLMIWVNLFCLPVELCGVWLLDRGRYRLHMLSLYLSELALLVFSAVCVGWSAGFQIPLVGLTMLAFFGEYLGRSLGLPYVPGLPVGVADFAVYLLTFQFRFHAPGIAPLPAAAVNWLQILWAIPAFALMVAGMYMMVRMTSHSERVLTNQAETDKLTGLYNRAGYDQLRTQIELKTTTLVLVDADKFKDVNDRCGHEVGDRVLKKIARILKQNFRVIDFVCRIGGDEFVVLMRDTPEPEIEQITAKVSRINRELSHTEDKLPLVSVSVGVAYGGEAEDWKELFNHADMALYQVKQNGRRGCRFYRP